MVDYDTMRRAQVARDTAYRQADEDFTEEIKVLAEIVIRHFADYDECQLVLAVHEAYVCATLTKDGAIVGHKHITWSDL